MKIDVSSQIERILEGYVGDVKEVTNEAQEAVAKECVQKLKNTSPKRVSKGKHYANGWTVKRARGPLGVDQVVIYNKNKPQLTHLLEKGHVVRNGKGTYGRTKAIPHIAPVEEYAAEKLPEEIERKLK